MRLKDIKQKMKEYYRYYVETKGTDESYIELFNSLKILNCAGLIDDNKWNKIFEYDSKLFVSYDELNK